MEKYNLEKLVKVSVRNFKRSVWYYYRKKNELFGISFRKEGFYRQIWSDFVSLEVPKNHIFKDGIVYEKPQVTLHYQSDYSKTYVFDTYNEALSFAGNLTNDRKWIL